MDISLALREEEKFLYHYGIILVGAEMTETTVLMRVPRSLRDRLKRKAKERGVSMWQVLLEAINALDWAKKGIIPRGDLDKVSWYVYKVSASFGELRANPSEENKRATLETLRQLHERLGVEVEDVAVVVRQYDGSYEKRKVLNDAAKLTVMRILEKFLVEQ
jgi:nucleotide-binding universal stress UspA family protein